MTKRAVSLLVRIAAVVGILLLIGYAVLETALERNWSAEIEGTNPAVATLALRLHQEHTTSDPASLHLMGFPSGQAASCAPCPGVVVHALAPEVTYVGNRHYRWALDMFAVRYNDITRAQACYLVLKTKDRSSRVKFVLDWVGRSCNPPASQLGARLGDYDRGDRVWGDAFQEAYDSIAKGKGCTPDVKEYFVNVLLAEKAWQHATTPLGVGDPPPTSVGARDDAPPSPAMGDNSGGQFAARTGRSPIWEWCVSGWRP